MTEHILEDKDRLASRPGSADEYGQGATKDLTTGQADGPAGTSGVWVEGATPDAGTDQASFDPTKDRATPSTPAS
jgi:hypothetical protein